MVNLVEEHLVINTTLRYSNFSQVILQIPVVLVIGNHESGGYGIPIEDAPPYLWDYFPHRISLIQSLTPEDVMAPVTIHKLDLSQRGAEAYHGHVLGHSASLLALDTMQGMLKYIRMRTMPSHSALATHSLHTRCILATHICALWLFALR